MNRSLLPAVLGPLAVAAFVPSSTAQKIYWTHNDFGDHRIQRADLDGSNVETIPLQILGALPESLAIDPLNRRLYWGSPVNYISLADDSDQGTLIDDTYGVVRGIAVDPLDRRI